MAVKQYQGNDGAFLAGCEKAGTPATHRQYRKWCQKRGSALKAYWGLKAR